MTRAINIHARQKYLLGRQKNDVAQLLRAWEPTQTVLDLLSAKELHPVCIRLTLAMTPQVPARPPASGFRASSRTSGCGNSAAGGCDPATLDGLRDE